MEATTTISALQILNLMQGIATTNLGYLGICVTVIIFAGGLAGGFYYIFNFKPVQKSIEKQESELGALKKEIEKKLETINTDFNNLVSTQTKQMKESIASAVDLLGTVKTEALNKINEAEKLIKDFTIQSTKDINALKSQYQSLVLDALWKEQYMWAGNEVYANSLTALIQYMEKAIEYKMTYLTDLWFDRLKAILERIKYYDYDDKEKTKDNLLEVLNKIVGKDEQKNSIKALIAQVFRPSK